MQVSRPKSICTQPHSQLLQRASRNSEGGSLMLGCGQPFRCLIVVDSQLGFFEVYIVQ